MALKNFQWFDSPAQLGYSPSSIESYVSGGPMSATSFTPHRSGGLAALGNIFSGIAAPFLGDYNWMQRQASIDAQNEQSNMIIQQQIMENYNKQLQEIADNKYRAATLGLKKQEVAQDREYKMKEFEANQAWRKAQIDSNRMQAVAGLAEKGIYPANLNAMGPDQLVNLYNQGRRAFDIPNMGTFISPERDALKAEELAQKKLQNEWYRQELSKMTAGGDAGMTPQSISMGPNGISRVNFGVNPEVKGQMKLQQEGREDLQKQIPEVLDLFNAFDTVDKYATELGDFQPGVANQAIAKIGAKAQEFGNEPKMANYLGSVNQNLAKIARKQNDEKGALSTFDVEKVLKGLGNTTAPLSVKKTLINEMRTAARKKILSRLNSANITLDQFRAKYPDAFEKMFFKSGDTQIIDGVEYQRQENGKWRPKNK